ncbi:PDZ/DHR/GLGF domain-containing protein, partial [Streptomyces sp. NPDC003832]
EGRLHAGDVIKAVDGKAVEEPADVAELVTGHRCRGRLVEGAASEHGEGMPGSSKNVLNVSV